MANIPNPNPGLNPGMLPEHKRVLKIERPGENPYQNRVFQPGEKIGPNRIEQLIGEGGNATVYKVWNETLEVHRAIKVLKMTGNKEARERFMTEAKILADISHPNIVQIYNLGFFDQTPFIEMEYIDGVPIKKLISQNKLIAMPAAASIAYFVCQALYYAHTKDYTLYGNVYHGLIHRDIKPDNIVISKDGLVKLMDFGIARPSEVSLHTVGAKIMGTLVYLSPEQLNGTNLDHRSDIFSLGCVLYEMITGERAYPQKTLVDLVQKKTKGEYKPVEACGIPIPDQMVKVVKTAMALTPESRFETASDFAHELFNVFRQISDRAPQDVVYRYIHDPTSVTSSMLKKQTSKTVPLLAITALGVSVLVLIAALLFFFAK
jgi:eukaryotic-like serine/threonine-protein kinase